MELKIVTATLLCCHTLALITLTLSGGRHKGVSILEIEKEVSVQMYGKWVAVL